MTAVPSGQGNDGGGGANNPPRAMSSTVADGGNPDLVSFDQFVVPYLLEHNLLDAIAGELPALRRRWNAACRDYGAAQAGAVRNHAPKVGRGGSRGERMVAAMPRNQAAAFVAGTGVRELVLRARARHAIQAQEQQQAFAQQQQAHAQQQQVNAQQAAALNAYVGNDDEDADDEEG